MKFLFTLVITAALGLSVSAQKAGGDALATATGFTFTPSSLSAEGQKLYTEQKTVVANERSQLLAQMIADQLLETEAKSRNVTREAVLQAEVKKLPDPAEAEIKQVYDANRANFGTSTLEDMRPRIIAFLRQNARNKAANDFVETLRPKYKFTLGKDVNAADLKPMESLFSINGSSVSAQQFDERFKADIYDTRAEIADQLIADLESAIFSTLVEQEAKTRNVASGDVIAAEITNKLRDFTDEEREGLETAFRKTLFAKYNVKMLIREPEPVAHNVSVDDDPSTGKATAPVTVVMFSDFQCSACSATHPVLKKVLAEYGDKIRFVVRDFPLETVHENAFRAARAANAALAQGKFFEYTEVLYHNQDNLDDASLKKYAADLGLNIKQFELDFTSEKTAAEIRKDMADGAEYGAGGTPTIFVNGVKVNRLSAEGFRAAIDRALSKTASK